MSIMGQSIATTAVVILIFSRSFSSVSCNPMNRKDHVIRHRLQSIDPAGKYHLEYEMDLDTKRATFLVVVETKGYVGFGLSPTGGMNGADIVIGGVYDDGRSYFEDRHGVGNSEPVLDARQDYELTMVSENATHTTLQFYRAFDTCDDHDVAITDDTVKIIWSYGDADVVQYHGGNRGTTSANPLDPVLSEFDESGLDKWTLTANITMPTQATTYWCTMHKSPANYNVRRHVVAFDTKLPSVESLRHTHHLTMFRCRAPLGQDPDQLFGPLVGSEGGECHVSPEQQIIPIHLCMDMTYVWAIGGKMMVFPENVGYPINKDGSAEYWMLEIHYDNPGLLDAVRFESAIEVYSTTELREHETGVGVIAHSISYSHVVPGHTASYTTVGHCSSRCTQDAVPTEGINVFNAMLHSHKLGRQLRLRHFRGRRELPWITADDNYDFDFQQNRPLREHVKILPGDHLTIECGQSSLERANVTIAGFGTTEEMCQGLMMYYPVSNFSFCASGYSEAKIKEKFGIEEMEWDNMLLPPVVKAPESMANKTYVEVLNTMIDWTPEYIAALEQETRYHHHIQTLCGTVPPPNTKSQAIEVGYPELDYVYTPDNPCGPKQVGSQASTFQSLTDMYHIVVWVLCATFFRIRN